MACVVRFFAAILLAVFLARPAFAYIGPGAGLGVLAAFWALLTAVISAVGFLILWPLRHRLRRRKPAADEAARARRQEHVRSRGEEADGAKVGGRAR